MKIESIISRWSVHMVVLAAAGLAVAIFIDNPLGIEEGSSLPYYFFSASFQGIAAILGLSLIGFIFIYERWAESV